MRGCFHHRRRRRSISLNVDSFLSMKEVVAKVEAEINHERRQAESGAPAAGGGGGEA